MKRLFVYIITILIMLISVGVASGCGCASCERELKSCRSDISGGLDRIVIVYNLNGEEMARYEGKLDLATEDGCVQFEYNGKRIIWYNAIVSIIEK